MEEKPSTGAAPSAHRNDSRQDFMALMEAHQPALVRFLHKRTRDFHQAEDLCQETFFRAFQALPGLESRRCMKSWLYSIAYHVSVDWLRGHVARKRSLEVLQEREGSRAVPAGVDEILIEREEREARKRQNECLWNKVRELPPPYKEVFEERYRRSSPIAQISRRTGVSEGNVKVRLFRARRLLMRVLQQALRSPRASSA